MKRSLYREWVGGPHPRRVDRILSSDWKVVGDDVIGSKANVTQMGHNEAFSKTDEIFTSTSIVNLINNMCT